MMLQAMAKQDTYEIGTEILFQGQQLALDIICLCRQYYNGLKELITYHNIYWIVLEAIEKQP